MDCLKERLGKILNTRVGLDLINNKFKDSEG